MPEPPRSGPRWEPCHGGEVVGGQLAPRAEVTENVAGRSDRQRERPRFDRAVWQRLERVTRECPKDGQRARLCVESRAHKQKAVV